MKKHIILSITLIMLSGTALACNICGMAPGGNYLGIMPQYQKNFVGTRYQYRAFETTHPPSIIPGLGGRKSYEKYHSAELYARWCPGKRWQLFAFGGFQHLIQNINNETTIKQGLSDPVLLGYYSVLPPQKPETVFKHMLQLGAGIKAPILKLHNGPDEGGDYNPAFQLGTGSFDKLISAIYTVKTEKWGINADATYSLNGSNKYDYKMGNRLNASIRGFGILKRCNSTWMASTGVNVESANADQWAGAAQRHTGGNLVMGLAGIDRFSEHWTCGAVYRLPVSQNLSSGYVESRGRWMVNLCYLF